MCKYHIMDMNTRFSEYIKAGTILKQIFIIEKLWLSLCWFERRQ